MVSDKFDEAARRAVAETFENLAFMEIFPVDEASPGEEALMTSSLLVHEPQQGEVRISLAPALLDKIAQNVFGPSPDACVHDPQDLLAELLNTIAGRFLIEALPPEQNFCIGLPELDLPPSFPEDTFRVWHFCAEGFHATLSVSNL